MGLAMMQMGDALILKKRLEANIGPYLVVVKGVAAGSVALPAAADANFMGVTTENGLSGEYRDVAVSGSVIVKCTAAVAILEGALVSIHGTTGKIKPAAPAAGSNSYIVGVAMEPAAADGDVIGVLLARQVLQG